MNISKKYINLMSLIVTLTIFISFVFLSLIFQNQIKDSTIVEQKVNNVDNECQNSSIDSMSIAPKTWKLEIPCININSEIVEGVSEEKICDKIEHFENTSVNGNSIALFAYNYGYERNIFSNIKDLNINDIANYTYKNKMYYYQVIANIIIKKEDLNNQIEHNEQGKYELKLITYVSNMSDKYRLVLLNRIMQ